MEKQIIGIQVEKELEKQLSIIASSKGLSKSALIRMILLDYIKKENHNNGSSSMLDT